MKTKKLFKSVTATTGLCVLLSSCGSAASASSSFCFVFNNNNLIYGIYEKDFFVFGVCRVECG